MAVKPKIGLILPVGAAVAPPEAARMYPDIEFSARSLGLKTMNREGYDSVVDRIGAAAAELAAEKPDALTLIGTSLSFYRGAAFNEEIVQSIRVSTGLPCTSMSTAILDGLRSVGARRIAVATAYIDGVNARLETFLVESGFEVASMIGLSIVISGTAGAVPDRELIDLGKKSVAMAGRADALLVSCGGLKTLDIATPLEDATGLPVVSSMPAALWAAARLLGGDGRVRGFGRMLEGAGR